MDLYNHPRDKGLPQILEGYPGILGLENERKEEAQLDISEHIVR